MTTVRLSDSEAAVATKWNAEDCLEEALRRVRMGQMTGRSLLVINVDNLRQPDEIQWMMAQLTEADAVLLMEFTKQLLTDQVLRR